MNRISIVAPSAARPRVPLRAESLPCRPVHARRASLWTAAPVFPSHFKLMRESTLEFVVSGNLQRCSGGVNGFLMATNLRGVPGCARNESRLWQLHLPDKHLQGLVNVACQAQDAASAAFGLAESRAGGESQDLTGE